MTVRAIYSVDGNGQRLDGGSMFGNCPRAVWERWAAPDASHRIALACRCMLVLDDADRWILFETGIGAFFESKLRERYGVTSAEHVLLASLAQRGVQPEDVDVVVLSHLHFDHAGGLLSAWTEGQEASLVFPKATAVVGRHAWERARAPHSRDRASFIPELQVLLEASGRLEIVDGVRSDTLGNDYSFRFSDGHTPGLMLTRVAGPQGPITFMGDLIPGTPWVHLPITMGYDRFPELLIDEKRGALEDIVAESGWLFYTHDPDVAASRVALDEGGKYRAIDSQAHVAWDDRSQ